MKTFKLTGHKGAERIELGIIKAADLHQAAFFLAKNFPEHYFGAGINQIDGGGDCPDFLCIAVKDYYKRGDGTYPTALEVAVDDLDSQIKMDNGFCDTWIERDGVCRQAWKKIAIPFDGRNG